MEPVTIIVGVIFSIAAYTGFTQKDKEVNQQPTIHTFEQCAIACESKMKLIKTRFQHCECKDRSSK